MPSARAAVNLVKNPGFESGKANWAFTDYGSSIVSSPTHGGTKSLRVINDFTGAKKRSHDAVQKRVTPVQPGKEYVFSVWVRGENVRGIGAGGKPMGMLRWRSGRRAVRRWLNMHAPYGTYTWRQMTCYCEAPPGAVTCDVFTRSWWDCTNGVTYWDDFELKERDLSGRGSLRATYQAESASVRSQCTTSSAKRDYTGSGYLVPKNKTAYVQWDNVNAGSGNRILVIRYSMEAGRPKWRMLVNGVSKGQKTPLPTSSPESWATIAWTASLAAGGNTVRLKLAKGVVGPWIDKLEVYSPSAPTSRRRSASPPRRATPRTPRRRRSTSR